MFIVQKMKSIITGPLWIGVLLFLISLFCSSMAHGATFSAAKSTYSWESTTNVLNSNNFAKTCTNYPVDDDQALISFGSGFTFPWNGVNYTSIRMFSNGQLQLGADTGAFRVYSQQALPEGNSSSFSGCISNQPANNLISVAWVDLNPSQGGSMSWQIKGTGMSAYAVFSWKAVKLYNSNTYLTMQAILYANGSIKMQYQTVSGSSWSAVNPTVGVQVSSSDYTEWTPNLTNSTALIFTPNNLLNAFIWTESTQNASTCGSVTATLKALTSTGSVYTGFTGTVNLSTSTGHGSWSIASGNGVLTPGSADSGTASYTFSASDNGAVVLTFTNEHAETLTHSATSQGITGTSVGVSFSQNALVVDWTDSLRVELIVKRPHAVTLSWYKQDPVTGRCSIVTGYSGVKNLDAWVTVGTNHPSSALLPGWSNNATCSGSTALPSNPPAVNASSNNLSTTFTNGVAKIFVCTSDVGQWTLNVRDDALSYASSVVSGTSSMVTVRPFALWIDNVMAGTKLNPGGLASSGSAFAAAGTPFSLKVSAKAWSSGQDSLSAGQPNPGVDLTTNDTVPSYASNTVINVDSITPAMGVVGGLTGQNVQSSSFLNGQATANLTYSEVGSVSLKATSLNYLNSTISIPGVSSSPIGRWVPATLMVSQAQNQLSCASGGFAYMGQPWTTVVNLKAVNVSGNVTLNYDSSLNYTGLAQPVWHGVDQNNGVDLASRLVPGTSPLWRSGQWSYNQSMNFNRNSSPDGPFDGFQLGLAAVDGDGVSLSNMNMNYSQAGACTGSSCNAVKIDNPFMLRWGRLELLNASKSLLTTIQVPVQVLYWNKVNGKVIGWAVNNLDVCTVIPASAWVAGMTQGGIDPLTLPNQATYINQGKAWVSVKRAGTVTGSGAGLLSLNLGMGNSFNPGCTSGWTANATGAGLTYLQSNFCSGTNFNGNPTSKLIFGSRSSDKNRIIFQRELY